MKVIQLAAMFYKQIIDKESLKIRNDIFIKDVVPILAKKGFIKSPFYTSCFGRTSNNGIYIYDMCRLRQCNLLEKLRQMVLQYLSNAGKEGAKRDSIYEYLKDVLPQNKTEEQKLRGLGDLLKAMKKDGLIRTDGRNWYEK